MRACDLGKHMEGTMYSQVCAQLFGVTDEGYVMGRFV